jgi:hypothetical protein
VPYRLEPGDVWDGGIEQDQDLEAMIQHGHLLVVLYHSASSKPVKKRLKWSPRDESKRPEIKERQTPEQDARMDRRFQ